MADEVKKRGLAEQVDIEAPPTVHIVKPQASGTTIPQQKQCCRIPAYIYGSLVALSDGFVNANTKKRFGTYGGMMTGNTVSLGMSIADEKVEDVFVFVSILSCFFVGGLLAWALEPVKYRKSGSFRWLAPAIFVVFFMLEFLNAYVAETAMQRKWVSIMAAFAMVNHYLAFRHV